MTGGVGRSAREGKRREGKRASGRLSWERVGRGAAHAGEEGRSEELGLGETLRPRGKKREERRWLRGEGELGRRGPCGSEERKGPRERGKWAGLREMAGFFPPSFLFLLLFF
jgi:hypothetical protein